MITVMFRRVRRVLAICGFSLLVPQVSLGASTFESHGEYIRTQRMEKSKENQIEGPTARLVVSGESLIKEMDITMSTLSESHLPKLDNGLTNVTDSFSGYRFLPHGEHFSGKGAKVVLGYDRTKIPSGYTEDDIRTYYYDEVQERWIALERDSVDRANRLIISRTTHFTDMINGVLQVPESPETQGFAPTMMTDLQAADPTAKVAMIEAPQANNRGSANLSYPFEMPPARNGMAPNLALQYSSDAGSGWLGQGWNISTSSITVDTRWGVPRYNEIYESETYLLDGEMLLQEGVGLAHRNLNQTRQSSVAVFYPRKESSFSEIRRIGNSPSEYVWEVIDRKGTKFTYGALKINETGEGENAKKDTTRLGMLCGSYQGGGRTVISEWRLIRVEEIHGDYVEYVYRQGKNDDVSLYLDSVKAGNAGEEPHTIVTFLSHKEKNIKRNDARYGYLTSSNELLEQVNIYFEGKFLRGYKFEYKDNSSFYADLLESISHIDSKGNVFASHKLDYHDFEGSLYEEDEKHYSVKHNIKNIFEGVGDLFAGKVSMISGGSSMDGFSVGGGANAGVLAFYGGVNYSYGHNNSRGNIALTDLNGDGVPDRVYMDGNSLYYQPALPNGEGDKRFGDPVVINGAPKEFSLSTSSSHTLSEDIGAGFSAASIGVSFSQSWNDTKVKGYFQDVNSDGLVDIVYKGAVHFNHLENGHPVFTRYSSDTENPLASMDVSNIPTIDVFNPQVSEEQQGLILDSLKKKSPLHDVVKVWRAPFAGSVAIKYDVEFTQLLSDKDKDIEKELFLDGVTFSVQHQENVLLNKKELKKDEKIGAEVKVKVAQGDYIFFRLGSNEQGVADNINFTAEINYLDANGEKLPEVKDETGNLFSYHSTHDFIKGFNTVFAANDSGQVISLANDEKSGILKQNKTLGDVKFRLTYVVWGNGRDSVPVVLEKVLKAGEITETKQAFDLFDELQLAKGDSLRMEFAIVSDLPFADGDAVWNPMVRSVLNEKEELIALLPSKTMYNNYLSLLPDLPSKVDVDQSNEDEVEYLDGTDENFIVQIEPHFNYIQDDEDEEDDDDKITEARYYLYDTDSKVIISRISDGAKLPIEVVNGKNVQVLVFHDTPLQKNSNAAVTLIRKWEETVVDANGISSTEEKSSEIELPVILRSVFDENITRLGSMYRGWGQFAYKGENEKIELAHLVFDKSKYNKDDFEKMKEEENNDNLRGQVKGKFGSVTDENFFSMGYDVKQNAYVGATSFAYITPTTMQSSRMGNDRIDIREEIPSYDVSTGEAGKTGQMFAPTLLSKSFTSSQTLTGGISAFGVSASHSKTTSTTETAFMDLNSDGYPDWISMKDDEVEVSYTGVDGLEYETKKFDHFPLPKQESDGFSVGANGSGPASSPTNSKSSQSGGKLTITALKEIAKQKAAASSPLAVTGSLGASHASSHSINEWYDVNGDGLVDMVFENSVRLNLGYTFTDKLSWQNFGAINASESNTVNGGANIKIPLCGSANISAGVNGSYTMNNTYFQLMDVNGDGLPDKVEANHGKEFQKDKTFNVAINGGLGTKFTNNENLKFSGSIGLSKSVSVTEHANGGVTIPVWIFTVTPFFNASNTQCVSSSQSSVADFNGDGFADLIHSESNDEVSVRYSRIGATNKLKSVTNPFGGKITIDYEHTTPSTDHPGGKWAMSGVTINDGTGLNPEMHTRFHYEEGKHDRRERDFLGFGKVYTYQLDVKDNLADTVRTNLQEFDNSNYFKAGQLIRTLIAEADTMDKLREERTDYNLYSVSNKSITLLEGSLSVDEASTFSAPYKKVVTAYESSEPDADDKVALPLTEETYDYSKNYANLITYTNTDLTDGSSYKTEITHLDKLGVPTSVKVTDGNGKEFRSITAKYENEFTPWAITQFTQNTGDGETVTDLEYDHFGNIAKKTLPKNEKGQRMFFSYTYDRKYNMYPTRVTDAFGYRSEMENYDYRYGIPLTVRDMNGYTVQYHIDDLGRTDTIIAPNEQSAGMPFTIAYKYFDAGSDYRSRYAETDHYDPQHPNDPLRTVTHVDGLGRPHQVKKEAEIYGEGVKYIVSGRVGYDALGRESVAYHPATCGISEEGEIAEFSSQVMKTSLFDALDRPTMEILPADEAGGDSSFTKMAYSIATDKKLLKTTITAPNGDISHSYADGGGQTVLAERFDPVSNEVVPINYYFDAIGQLDSLTDAGGNTTRYTYDKAGRTLSVSHPSVGLTTFKYDIAGNMLEKVTENLRKEEKLIKYEYDYNRLKKVTYPNHPENDVTYTYGGPNARENRVGRLALLEDGSGATEYSYGRMGEVTKQRRTLVIPNVAVATYTTEWNYDSHNRLQEMIYPDGEKIKYFYNLGGQLSSIVGEKEYLYRYIDSTGYDAYEQKVYQRMGNGTKTTYDYSKERRRLKNLKVTSPKVTGGAIMNNAYGYDVMDNIISLVNNATPQIMQNGKTIGGSITHNYEYDNWSRLVHADGKFVAGSKSATYNLTMGYDKLYNITSKKLDVTQNNFQFDGTLKAGHDFTYKYDPKDPFRLLSVDAKEYRSSTEEVDTTRREHSYAFDGNGNLVLQLSDLAERIDSASFADTAAMQVRQYLWDEDNHLLAINDNGFVSNYFYDAAGERTVKISAPDLSVFVNGTKALKNDSALVKFVGYVSPYLVVSNGGRYTKHIYAGTQRIASKVGDIEAFGADPRRVEYAGANLKEVDFGSKYEQQTKALLARYDSLGVEHRPNTLNDYVGGQSFCCGEKEFEPSQTGKDEFETPDYEQLIFFYHPDHLGSTALVTDNDGNVVQSVAYIPYGEVFIEERNGTWNAPYLFNGKELDEETGLYYYGARYLNPTNGMWLSVDPLFEKYVGMSPYQYCNLNPLRFVDLTGMSDEDVVEKFIQLLPEGKREAARAFVNAKINEYKKKGEDIAIGVEYSLGGSCMSGPGYEGSLLGGFVTFLGGEDAGYVYSYVGAEGGIGGEDAVAVEFDLSVSLFVAVKSNKDADKTNFAGSYSYGRAHGGVKAVAGLSVGYSRAKGDWNVHSLEADFSFGFSFAPAIDVMVTTGRGYTSFLESNVGQPKGKLETILSRLKLSLGPSYLVARSLYNFASGRE